MFWERITLAEFREMYPNSKGEKMAEDKDLDVKLETVGKDVFAVIRAKIPKKPPESKSGKSKLLATSNGNLNTGLKYEGSDVILGLNLYIKK